MKNNTNTPTYQQTSNSSLVPNLNKKIIQLNSIIQSHKLIIEDYKKNTKTTIINEQQIHLENLINQNQRLKTQLARLKDPKRKMLQKRLASHIDHPIDQACDHENIDPWKQSYPRSNPSSEAKYESLLQQNCLLMREVQSIVANENSNKKSKCLNERSCIMIQKKINEVESLRQKSYQYSIQASDLQQSNSKLLDRIAEISSLLTKALQINKSMRIIA